MFKGYHFTVFDFEGKRFLVAYKSDKDLSDELEDAIFSFYYQNCDDDLDYQDIVNDIMSSFNVEWQFINHKYIEME